MEVCTTFKTTKNLRTLEDVLTQRMGMTKKAFQKKAIESFINGQQEIDPDFCIKDKEDPAYVIRSVREQAFMTSRQERILKEIAKEKNVYFTTLVLQAISDYCVELSDELPKEFFDEIKM